MAPVLALSLWAVVGIHESTLSPLTGPDYTRGYVRGIDGVAVDPASVAGVDGYALQYRHRLVRNEGGLGRVGAFGAAPFSRLVLFGGYEWFLIPNARFERGTLGLAGVISPRLWAGISFQGLSSPHAELRGTVWNFSLYSELFSWLTLSAGVDGFNHPNLLGAEIRPDYVFGASVRPIVGEPWLTLGTEVRIGAGGQRNYNVHLTRAVVDVSPWEGVHLTSAYGRTVDDVPTGSPLTAVNAHELWFGLSLALGGLEARVASRALRESATSTPVFAGDPFLADNQLALTVRFKPSESIYHPGGKTVQVPLLADLEDPAGLLEPGSPIRTVLYHLDRLADDPTVDAVLLPIANLDVGMATVDELRAAIKRLRAAGKTVVAHLSTASDKSYIVAAACNLIRMDPAASLVVDGFSVTMRYYAGALAKVGVRFESVGIGDYKTGPDALTRAEPRPQEIEVQEQIVGQAYSTLMRALTQDRGFTEAQAQNVLERALFTARAAKEANLIDDYTSPIDPKAVPVYYPSGQPLNREPPPSRRWSQRPIVRVIPIVGTIVARPGDNILPGATAAATEIIPAIEEAARDGDVEAVVLRIESPGGDVLASDLIWRAVRRLREVKPVVVSMGDVAASGGYYVAAPAHKIFAEPNTVTGSIGIFVMRAQLQGLFEKLDINSVTIKRGPHADMDVVERPLSEEDRERMRRNLRAYYDTFVAKVALGRGMQEQQVHQVAQGRVYTGAAARDLGLVDELGGLGPAIREAKRLAGIEPDDDVVVELPKHSLSLTRMLLNLTGLASAQGSSLVEMLSGYATQLQSWDGRALALLPVYYELDR